MKFELLISDGQEVLETFQAPHSSLWSWVISAVIAGVILAVAFAPEIREALERRRRRARSRF